MSRFRSDTLNCKSTTAANLKLHYRYACWESTHQAWKCLSAGQASRLVTHGCTYIFPAQCGVTVFTVDVGDSVKSCEQQPLLSGAAAHVHPEKHTQGGVRRVWVCSDPKQCRKSVFAVYKQSSPHGHSEALSWKHWEESSTLTDLHFNSIDVVGAGLSVEVI